MAAWLQLEACKAELNAAIEILSNHCQNPEGLLEGETEDTPQPLVLPQAPVEVHRARRTIKASITKLQILLDEPADCVQELSKQNQLLACINWLGEFQVLGCIPLRGHVPIKDVAELVGVPETQLRRIVRMTTTAGFLRTPQSAHVAHSALSAPFVTRPSYLDAVMFLSETAAPAALHMAAATQRFGQSQRPHESAYNVALNTSSSFAGMCDQRSKLQRQWPAYLRHALNEADPGSTDVLTCFEWVSLRNATVVEVNARSTETAFALAEMYPALHLIVQISEPRLQNHPALRHSTTESGHQPTSASETGLTGSGANPYGIPPQLASRITIERRISASSQKAEGAAVYLLHLPSPSPTAPSRSISTQIIADLKAHLGVLRRSSIDCRLILAVRPLLPPDTGSADDHLDVTAAAVAHVRDLALLQLANDHELETSELVDMVNSVADSAGCLVVVNELRAWNHVTVAFEVRYQSYSSTHERQPIAAPNAPCASRLAPTF